MIFLGPVKYCYQARQRQFIYINILFSFSRNHLTIRDTYHHEYFSEDLCGDRRSILVEIPSRQVVVRVDQHYRHVDAGFQGAYAIAKGDIGSGKLGFGCMYFGMSGRMGCSLST